MAVLLVAAVVVVRMARMTSTDTDDEDSSSSSSNNNNNNSDKALLLVERMSGTIRADFLLSERQSTTTCVVATLHMRMLRCQETKRKKLHRRRHPALCSFDLIPTEPRVWLCGRPTL